LLTLDELLCYCVVFLLEAGGRMLYWSELLFQDSHRWFRQVDTLPILNPASSSSVTPSSILWFDIPLCCLYSSTCTGLDQISTDYCWWDTSLTHLFILAHSTTLISLWTYCISLNMILWKMYLLDSCKNMSIPVGWSIGSGALLLIFCVCWSLVLASRRQTYCTSYSSGMGLSMFSTRDGPVRERVDDGSVGAIDISRFTCSRSSGLKNTARLTLVELVETVDIGVPLCRV
jgi:hypothetical protein